MTAPATSLLPVVLHALDDGNLHYTTLSDCGVALPIRTDRARYDCTVTVDDCMRTVSCYVGICTAVFEDRRLALANALTRANHGLRIGCFELDMDTGELRYRVGLDVGGGTLTPTMLQNIMAVAVSVSDRYHEALMQVIAGGADPRDAIAEVEQA